MTDERPAKIARRQELDALALYIDRLPYNLIADIVLASDDPKLAIHLPASSRQALDKLSMLNSEETMLVWRPLARKCWPLIDELMPSLQRDIVNGRLNEGRAWAKQVARLAIWLTSIKLTLTSDGIVTFIQPYANLKTCSDFMAIQRYIETSLIPVGPTGQFTVTLTIGERVATLPAKSFAMIRALNPAWLWNLQTFWDPIDNIVGFLSIDIKYQIDNFGWAVQGPEQQKVQGRMFLFWNNMNNENLRDVDAFVTYGAVDRHDYAVFPSLQESGPTTRTADEFIEFLANLSIDQVTEIMQHRRDDKYLGTKSYDVQDAVLQFRSLPKERPPIIWEYVSKRHFPLIINLMPSIQEKVTERVYSTDAGWGWQLVLIGSWFRRLAFVITSPGTKETASIKPFAHARTFADMKKLSEKYKNAVISAHDIDADHAGLNTGRIVRLAGKDETPIVSIDLGDEKSLPMDFLAFSQEFAEFYEPARLDAPDWEPEYVQLYYSIFALSPEFGRLGTNPGDFTYYLRPNMWIEWQLFDDAALWRLDVLFTGTLHNAPKLSHMLREFASRQRQLYSSRICAKLRKPL